MKKAASTPAEIRLSTPYKVIVPGFILVVLLLAVIALTAPGDDQATDEQCIMCHVDIYDRALRDQYIHAPVFERQCAICHLAEGADLTVSSGQHDALFSGTVVSQEILWRKARILPAATVPVSDHLVSLPQLQQTSYRFRILVSPAARSANDTVSASLWLGLNAADTSTLVLPQKIDLAAGLDSEIAAAVTSAELFRDGTTLYVSWQTTLPMHGWIELQELNGVELGAPLAQTTDQLQSSTHPALQDPAELAISGCYRCHAEATLGTSHPVRLYGGRDVRIPDDLPTVDGMLTCVTCHNPHSAPGEMLVRETIKTKLCVACHTKYKNSSPATMFQ